MGIYIKGMEMPEFGEKIIILTSSGYIEDVSGQVIDGVEAVSVSTHGRMINADALIRELEITEEDDRNGATLLMAVFLEVLKSAPTIIPADRPNAETEVQQEYLQNWHEEGE